MHVKVHQGGVVFAEVFKGVYSTIHLYYILHRGQLLESKSTMYATFRCIPFCLRYLEYRDTRVFSWGFSLVHNIRTYI